MIEPSAVITTETDRIFREIVLCLGGIFAAEQVDDAVIWQVTKSLDRLYERSRTRLLESHDHSQEPHPAVEDLLTRIGRTQ